MVNYKELILNRLLDKYEQSKSVFADSNRRIILKIKDIKEYDIENYDSKIIFHDVVIKLKQDGLVDFSWKEYEKGNILKEIWLNKENIQNVYLEICRKPIKETIENEIDLLKKSKFKTKWLEEYRNDMISYVENKYKINSLFPPKFANDIINVMKEIDKGQDNLKRVLSVKCFGDSKYFEKNIENIIIRVIKKYLLDGDEIYCNDDILLKVGISKYPEVIEFCGDLEYIIENEKVELKKETIGSYINSFNIRNMQNLKIKNASKILFIENKANYIDYIYNKKKRDEFVIYHGGMYSPAKGEFFKKIYTASENMLFYHWSDIDIGGFKIFARLRKIIPTLEPYKMDVSAFESKKEYWKKMKPEYIKNLLKLKNDKEYEIFYKLIDDMVKNGSKLEQEVFI